ncbi:MAG: hypothetical protein R3D63_06325 [Paracoccaceae bacterium]
MRMRRAHRPDHQRALGRRVIAKGVAGDLGAPSSRAISAPTAAPTAGPGASGAGAASQTAAMIRA